MAHERDLTQGSVLRALIAFGIPVFLANLLQACYSVVDMLIVGNFVGTAGLTAVSIGGMVINVVSSFCVGFCTGGQIVVAQFFGANDRKSVQKTIGALMLLCIALAIILPVAGIPLSDGILGIMHTPAESFADTKIYVIICLVCMLFTLGYHALTSVLRGVGDSKMPLVFMVISTVLNVILDIIMVGPMHMGVMGAALATVIAQGISFICALIYFLKQKGLFEFKAENFKLDKKLTGMVLRMGLPIAAQQTFLNLSAMFASSIINAHGLIYSTASGIGMKIENFSFLPHVAISVAISTVVGQNIGAGKPERAGKATRIGTLINICLGVFTCLVLQILAPYIVSFFDTNPAVIEQGVFFLRTTSFCYILGGCAIALNGLSTGVGDAGYTMLTVVLTHLVLRIGACTLFYYVLHLPIVWIYISYAGTPLLAIILMLIYIARGKWKTKSLVR